MNEVTMHVGKINNTDRRCVVLMAQNPHNQNTALIVDTDALAPRLHDALMDVVQKEGHTTNVLASLLERRLFTDTGLDMFTTLHYANVIQSVPIDNITLFPRPNLPVPLRVAVSGVGAVPQPPVVNESIRPPLEAPEPMNKAVMDSTFNPHANNIMADRLDDNIAVAQNIIMEAKMLETEAAKKREMAYKLVPSLRPHPTPVVTPPTVSTHSVAAEPPVKTAAKRGPKAGVKKATSTRKPKATSTGTAA